MPRGLPRSLGRWRMRPNPLFASEDPDLVRELIRSHPWATLVTSTSGAPLSSRRFPAR